MGIAEASHDPQDVSLYQGAHALITFSLVLI